MPISEVENIDCKTYLGDCLEILPSIPDKSIDMVLCDLPYGVLNRGNMGAKWDKVIPFEPLWKEYKRLIKENGAILLTGQGMFTSDLMQSNRDMWRYNLIWKRGNFVSGFLNAKKQPLRNHEDICVFYNKQCTYNPQMTRGHKNHNKGVGSHKGKNSCYGKHKEMPTFMTNEKYPQSILTFRRDKKIVHPTQKSTELFRYLIKTYTNEGETVLDNCMGSGTTLIACAMEKRNCIGIEKEPKYFAIAEKRYKDFISQQVINF